MIAIVGRSGDAPGYELRLWMQLRTLAPTMDIVREALPGADIILAIVGPNWADKPLHAEVLDTITTALQENRQIIPVLVQGGSMPAASELPLDLRPFATINAAILHNERFAEDVQTLLDRIMNGHRGQPWSDADVSGHIRIKSTKPALLLRAWSVIDNDQKIDIRIDGSTYGALRLYGDELSVPVSPGRHEVLIRVRWEKPLIVDVPPEGTVVVNVTRNTVTGGVRILGTTRS